MIEIKTDPPSYRHRRQSGVGQNVMRVIFFLIMIVPTCIIAYRIDLVNPRPQQVVVPQKPEPPPATPQDPVKRRYPLPRLQRPAIQPVEEPEIIAGTEDELPKNGDIIPLESVRRSLDPLPETPIAPDLQRNQSQIVTIGPPDNLPKPSAIVPLTFSEAVIRVTATPDNVPVDSVLCDIAFSQDLMQRSSGVVESGYSIVAEKLRHRGKHLQELPLKITGAGAAIELTVIRKNNAAICEIRPKFSLPTSGIEQLTIARGSQVHKKLTRMLDDAAAARESLPRMRDQLSQLQAELTEAQRAATATGSNPAETALIRHNANMAISRLNRVANNLSKSIGRADQLINQEPAMRAELNALNEIAEYSKGIASVATIYIRFYSGDTTIPASIR